MHHVRLGEFGLDVHGHGVALRCLPGRRALGVGSVGAHQAEKEQQRRQGGSRATLGGRENNVRGILLGLNCELRLI